MSYTIVTDICEGVTDCVVACPVACIHKGEGKNAKGGDWYWIEFDNCIDCDICLQVCPVKGAIVPEKRSDLQKMPFSESSQGAYARNESESNSL